MAPLGVVIGFLITNVGSMSPTDGPIAVIEAVATGTFLYVTFLELVPHEFIGDVRHGPQKVLSMGLGFTVMAIMQAFTHADHGEEDADSHGDHDNEMETDH